MTRALLIVPPFIGVAYGPLLGPAMLVASGRAAGHEVDVLDLNAMWVRELALDPEPRRFLGDHDRPAALKHLRRRFTMDLGLSNLRTHAEIRACAVETERSWFGGWAQAQLDRTATRPELVGLSIMYGDQVVPGLAITAMVRRQFPDATIVWGGAHVTAMREKIAGDERYDAGMIDGFVFGYAEATWTELLTAIDRADHLLPPEVVRAGSHQVVMAREDLSVIPEYGDLSAFDGGRLTLPIQASRGCSYGKCAFCMYPAVEGGPRRCSFQAVIAAINRAFGLDAALSFKDSLVDHDLLLDLAAAIGGRVPWSACTKLDARLRAVIPTLARGGCRTLEIGLETIEPQAQKDAVKKQRAETFLLLLDAAEAAGVALVVNYMTGFPNADRDREEACKRFVQEQLDARSRLVAKLEHHELEVERLAPFGREPERHGIEIVGERAWSSVLEWRRLSAALAQIRPRRDSVLQR